MNLKLPNIKRKISNILPKFKLPTIWVNVIIFVLNVLILIPLFIIIHQNIVDPEWVFHIDRILLFLGIMLLTHSVLYLLRKIVLVLVAVYLLVLGYGTLFAKYGFDEVYDDYRSMIFAMSETTNPQDVIISKLLPFPNKSKILDGIEYNHPEVRNFALKATAKHFRNTGERGKYRRMVQCFAIFKEVRNRWNYVNDPKNREYIAHATESLQHFSGDCEDHAVLMAALIRSIGGTPRLIHTKAHIYPEMLIGDKKDFEKAVYLIKEVLFVEESKNKEIYYHIDERNKVWINLDYTAQYPGGPFMSNEIYGALTID